MESGGREGVHFKVIDENLDGKKYGITRYSVHFIHRYIAYLVLTLLGRITITIITTQYLDSSHFRTHGAYRISFFLYCISYMALSRWLSPRKMAAISNPSKPLNNYSRIILDLRFTRDFLIRNVMKMRWKDLLNLTKMLLQKWYQYQKPCVSILLDMIAFDINVLIIKDPCIWVSIRKIT